MVCFSTAAAEGGEVEACLLEWKHPNQDLELAARAEGFMSKRTGIAAIILGVAFNNYVYLHDLILQKHEGLIELGPKSAIGIAISVVVILAGVRALARDSSG